LTGAVYYTYKACKVTCYNVAYKEIYFSCLAAKSDYFTVLILGIKTIQVRR